MARHILPQLLKYGRVMRGYLGLHGRRVPIDPDLVQKHKLPVHFIGVGEGIDDLAAFTARDFAQAIAGIES